MAKTKSGHIITETSEEENIRINKLFPHMPHLVTLQPGGWDRGWNVLDNYIPYADKVYDFQLRPTDVMVMSFVKCGTMWISEVTWTMMKNHNFDNKHKDTTLLLRVPSLIADNVWYGEEKLAIGNAAKAMYPGIDPSGDVFLQTAAHTDDPRVLRAHAPLSLMPKDILDKCKVICIARNPKDMILSFKHFTNLVKSFNCTGTMDDMVDFLVNDIILYGPFWKFYKEAWSNRNHPNFHWIFFEDLKRNNFEEMIRLDKFLGTNLTRDKLEEIIEHTSFNKMKERDPVFGQFQRGQDNFITSTETAKKDGNFFRKGKSGGWKDNLTVSQNEKIDAWIDKNSTDTDLKMKY